MPMETARSLIDDLYRVQEHGKAEIVDGRLVPMSPTAGMPGLAAGAIYRSLHEHVSKHGGGRAYPDNVGFIVDLPRRGSVSPDVALHRSTRPTMTDAAKAEAEPAIPGWRMPVDALFE